jgi:hypothetical protein
MRHESKGSGQGRATVGRPGKRPYKGSVVGESEGRTRPDLLGIPARSHVCGHTPTRARRQNSTSSPCTWDADEWGLMFSGSGNTLLL